MELPPKAGAGPETTGNEMGREREELHREGPRIYVASLSDYNAGVLHGEWIEADLNPEDLEQAVTDMLRRSPTDSRAEEFAIHDFEGFGPYQPGEYDSLDWVSWIARGITEHGLAFGAWADCVDHDEDALASFEDAYLGEWSSLSAYVEELFDDLGVVRDLHEQVPELLQGYVEIDVEGFARDMELGGDITSVEHRGGVWLFATNG
jgi:antirestriction protein